MASKLLQRGARACKGCPGPNAKAGLPHMQALASKVRSQATVAAPLEQPGYHGPSSTELYRKYTSIQQHSTGLPGIQHFEPEEPEEPYAETHRSLQQSLQESDEPWGELYWQKIPRWKDVSEEQWNVYKWQFKNGIHKAKFLKSFLKETLPEEMPGRNNIGSAKTVSREEFIQDFENGVDKAPMAIRLTPHILSVIDWSDPYNDPVRMQYIPLASTMLPDHPECRNDSLGEKDSSPVKGLVHRYPTKALFLANSFCPLYCRFCTRAYQIGLSTGVLTKESLAATIERWGPCFDYIEQTPNLEDIVVSGGDTFMLDPAQLYYLGKRLLDIPHIKRIRVASKGLAVSPSRFLDPSDQWTASLVTLSNYARKKGKLFALHTHVNHPNELTWVGRKAAHHLYKAGVTVRNQTVLLKGVNDTTEVMGRLIKKLADAAITPYYVYQADMVPGVEDLRTPLQTILNLETELRGSISGYMMPQFVVDLPSPPEGGKSGGKRPAALHASYDRETGISEFHAPAITGDWEQVFRYYDPITQ